MKKWVLKTKNILRSKRGETLMESIVSLLILTILLTAVGMMIQTALNMTLISTQNAREMQHDIANPTIRALYATGSTDDTEIIFSSPEIGAGFTASHEVVIFDGGIIAFSPPEGAGGP